MWAFFRGWRRKVGVVALTMALVLMGEWIRSYVIQDVFRVEGEESCFRVCSVVGKIRISKIFLLHKVPGDVSWRTFEIAKHGTLFDAAWSDWHREYAGFSVGSKSWPEGERYWGLPYWAIVVPLTLLSAYLLLWPHRRDKPKEQLNA